MKKMLLIANLYSGKGEIKNSIVDIIDFFNKKDYLVTFYTTQKKKDATNIAKKYVKDFDIIVCCGGDGTLSEVVTGVLSTAAEQKIGYIPAGTTNDFATSLGIPREVKKAMEIIPKDCVKFIDVGNFNKRNFIYIASFGLFTESSYETPQELKKVFGYLAYVFNSLKSLTNISTYHLKVEYEDKIIEDDFVWGAISNCTSVGGFLKLDKKKVKVNDGKFEVILLKSPKNVMEFQNILNKLLNKEFDNELIRLFYIDKIKITSDKKIPWTLDGEYGETHNEVYIDVMKQAVELIVEGE